MTNALSPCLSPSLYLSLTHTNTCLFAYGAEVRSYCKWSLEMHVEMHLNARCEAMYLRAVY